MRATHVDIAKGLGMTGVVLGHSALSSAAPEVKNALFAFHMPLFFLLSGLFIDERRPFPVQMASRTVSLLMPYFVFATLYAVLDVAADSRFVNSTGAPLDELMLGVLLGRLSAYNAIPLWFLPHLFVATALLSGLIRLASASGRPRFVVVVFCAMALLLWCRDYAPAPATRLPWSLDLLPVSCFFLAVGWSLKDRLLNMAFHAPATIAAALAFVAILLAFEPETDFYMGVFSKATACTAVALLGCYVTLSLSVLVSRSAVASRIWTRIGAASLYIMLFQFVVMGFLDQWAVGTLDPVSLGAVQVILAVGLPTALYRWVGRSGLFARMRPFVPRAARS